ncbi:hypothetical protein AMATHDRAFT_67591 [Amanita thiersii Skay4041]|uniref:C2H2-type domain-containing protein n=1 Tax=Amanita thiersii Skay4041 TaxID=703135 RepID=A0A2A9NGY0_9AGAR|nr:hypothetical protein AMATHDRAFT_67591 [Amanita thiersii Skay4041]
MFVNKQALEQHTRDSHKKPPGSYCSRCKKSFRCKADLERHNASPVHNPKKQRCFACSAIFKTPSGLAQHIESTCPNLGQNRHHVTAAIQSLKVASPISLRLFKPMKFMTGAKRRPLITYYSTAQSFNGKGFECCVCHKTFHSRQSLEAHLNSPVHDEDQFKCPKCRMQFKLVSGLVQHIESEACGISSLMDVERRLSRLTGQVSRALAW